MNRFLPFALSLLLLCSCTEKPASQSAAVAVKPKPDSDKQHVIASTVAKNEPNDSTDVEPTFDEVKADLLSKYDKIERIDTTIIVGGDSLHVHEKYYCLKDNKVIVPKRYLWGGDTTKDFVTHSFATQVVIMKNKDTIINKIFKKSDFNRVLNPEERKYAIIFDARFEGYYKQYDGIIFGYSITIPLTDIGVPAYIAVNKKGEYKILDEYAKLDEN